MKQPFSNTVSQRTRPVQKGLNGTCSAFKVKSVNGNKRTAKSERRCAEHVRQLGGESPLPTRWR
jgi:hypothetical protein